MTTICDTSGKQALSRDEAGRQLRRLEVDESDPERALLNIYRCRDCGRWHVGHKYGSVRRHPGTAVADH